MFDLTEQHGYYAEIYTITANGSNSITLNLKQKTRLNLDKTPAPRDEDLADAGAGVTTSKVWGKVVRARADEDDNVQLGC
ncbi:hypothetical protein SCUP234_12112 [Seiridium cupressi]